VARVLPVRKARVAAPTSHEDKLHLLEFFLASDDPAECAQRAAEWLAAQAGASLVLCAMVDASGARLAEIARHGMPRRGAGISVDLDQRDHRLVSVLWRTQPVVLSENGGDDGLGLSHEPLLAVPLHGLTVDEDVRVGVLLVRPVSPSVARESRWVGDMLGPRLARLRAYRGSLEGHRRLDRDRTLLQGVIDAVSDPILLTDPEGRMLIANTSAENLFASRDGESEGRQRAVALNNMMFSAALSWSGAATAEPFRRELLLVDPDDGSDLLFELLGAVVNDPQQGTGIVSILRDVTDLRRATEEIEENYRRFRLVEADIRAERDRLNLLIDSVVDPILVTDPGGAIVMMNNPAERLFTVPENASTDAALRVNANDAHFSSFVANLLFLEAQRHRGDIGLVDPNTGAGMPFEAIAGKVLSEHGELVGVVTILHDRAEALEKERLYEQLKRASDELEEKVRQATAELVRQNELLRRQHIQLEQASALKSQFLANMSHEFRTPLNAILGYTSMLLQGIAGELSTQQKRNLGRIDSNSKHLLSLINDILDISRIEAGKMPLHATEFLVPDLIAEVMAELDPIIVRSKLKVTTDLDSDAKMLHSDRQKVKQIVLNLLSNALKFTPEGSIVVTGRLRRGDRTMAIAVKDTGIGIAPEDQSTIFEDFRQADSSPTREYGGAGLGLSICRRLASMLGGRITVESKLGAGSTFTLILPVRAGEAR
jgi:signal transduction histidine kinase